TFVSCFLSVSLVCLCCLFFFQAEDGIRDDLVTGVQTCALPIFERADLVCAVHRACADGLRSEIRMVEHVEVLDAKLQLPALREKIGRASCRERVEIEGGGGVVAEEREGRVEEGGVTMRMRRREQ